MQVRMFKLHLLVSFTEETVRDTVFLLTFMIDLHNPSQLPVKTLVVYVGAPLMDGFYWVPKGLVDVQVLMPRGMDLHNVPKCNTILLMHFNLLPVFPQIVW